ncbi:PLDc N-terminal domain-containing protein [Christiangramia lutea]|uniref:PLDc N-terminal domain-containing protein n=1 Tax=Christiangramia lutea TaxID=1607951 RepID=UPI003C2EAF8E
MSPQFGLYLWQTHIFLALLLVFYIILKVKSSFKLKLSWVLAIIFIPILGSFAYFSFGRKYLKN